MKVLRKITNWFYSRKIQCGGRIKLRILFFVIKYWPNSRVKELLGLEDVAKRLLGEDATQADVLFSCISSLLEQKENCKNIFLNTNVSEDLKKKFCSGECTISELAEKVVCEQQRKIQNLEDYKNKDRNCRQRANHQYAQLARLLDSAPYVPTSDGKDVGEDIMWVFSSSTKEMSAVDKLCIDSVKFSNSHRQVVVLREEDYETYVRIPQSIKEAYAGGMLKREQFTFVVKLLYLAEYGGTCLDSDVYMTASLEEAVAHSSFFAYRKDSWGRCGHGVSSALQLSMLLPDNENPYSCIASWFMHASHRASRMVCRTLGMVLAYCSEEWGEEIECPVDYLVTHAYYGDVEARAEFDEAPLKMEEPSHLLDCYLHCTLSDEELRRICEISSVHHIRNHSEPKEIIPHMVLMAMYRRYHDRKPLEFNSVMNACVAPEGRDVVMHYQSVHEKSVERLRTRIIKGGPEKRVRVSFLVSMASMFPAYGMFKLMRNDSRFDVKLVIIPECRFGEQERARQLELALKEFAEYTDNLIVVPADPFQDYNCLLDFTDIVVPSLPYDVSTPWYNLQSFLNQELLIVMSNYCLWNTISYGRCVIGWGYYEMAWKVFTETELNRREYEQYSIMGGKNVLLSGYGKMDEYSKWSGYHKPSTKTILICPHHSLKGGYNKELQLSNFLKYAEFFLALPKQYPDIKFIFRPHPALFVLLERDDFWGAEKVKAYKATMNSYLNVEWSEEPDYMKVFAESDALIQDCGSFLCEYFYTGKPQCYMLSSESVIEKVFAPIGQKCLKYCYLAYNERTIVDFIDNVVVGDKDVLRRERLKFAEKEIMINYPHASQVAVDALYESIMKP